MRGVEASGALMLVDSMITIQGLEKTLEDIRAVNRLNANFNKGGKKEITEAWQGLLTIAMVANKKTRVK